MSQCEETARMADTLAEKARRAGDTEFASILERAAKAVRVVDAN